MTKKPTPQYSPEVRTRAVRMVMEHQDAHASQWATVVPVASKIGCTAETLRKRVRQDERDRGLREGMTTQDLPANH